MKNFILKRIQGLHNYYSTGATADIPYFKTMSVFLFLIFLHYLELAFLLKRFDTKFDLFPFAVVAGQGLRALVIFLCFLPVYALITWLFPKTTVASYAYSDDKLVAYRNQFFLYACFLLVAIISTIWPSIKFR